MEPKEAPGRQNSHKGSFSEGLEKEVRLQSMKRQRGGEPVKWARTVFPTWTRKRKISLWWRVEFRKVKRNVCSLWMRVTWAEGGNSIISPLQYEQGPFREKAHKFICSNLGCKYCLGCNCKPRYPANTMGYIVLYCNRFIILFT